MVLNGSLKVVGGNIFTEDPPCDFVVGEQWRAREPDVAGLRQCVVQVQCQCAVLCAVRFIGNDDDIVALRVAVVRIHALVELLD